MKWYQDKTHPVWHLCYAALAMTGILYMNASHFDKGEVISVIQAVAALAVGRKLVGGSS